MHNDEQNERFFDSNTLYKKELKKKQHDLLNTSRTSNIQPTEALLNSLKEPLNKSPHMANSSSTPLQSSNKMLNLFTNLINRSRSSNSHQNMNQSFETQSSPPPQLPPPLDCSSISTDNNTYSNLKHLKRATSSTHLKKPQPGVKTIIQQNETTTNKAAFSTANLFGGRLSKGNEQPDTTLNTVR